MRNHYDELRQLAIRETGIDIGKVKRRDRPIIQAKAAVINILRQYYGYTTVKIAKELGLHHTTIVHHSSAHLSRYRFESDYSELFDKLSVSAKNSDNVDEIVELIRSI